MFFFLKYQFSKTAQFDLLKLEGEALPDGLVTNTLCLQPGIQHLETLDLPGSRLLLLGDPVFENKKSLAKALVPANGKFEDRAIYQNIKGHYYWFLIHANGLRCGTSFGAIFPIYFCLKERYISISSSPFFLAGKENAQAGNRRNLLERLLFNYPFFDSTWWETIQLLDAHRYLDLQDGSATVAGDFDLAACFGQPELTGRKSLAFLASSFQEEVDLFLPEEPFAISMTGGFDGRTLAAAASKRTNDFFTYSFGRPGNSDVTFPMSQAEKLRLAYYPIFLDEKYVAEESLPSARSFMRMTGFNGNFGRPHYEFAARKLAEKTRYILTGNFGSELFRALHLPGVMMSQSLIKIFAAADDSWKDFLKQTTAGWDPAFFKNELNALVADLEIYLGKMRRLEPNQRFYHFVFSEIHRKYFGPELVMQSRYLRNRTPFLSLRFFQHLNRTAWSGVHSRLFEKNKSKRMKGQKFYAAFLRQTSREIYRMPTNKGYSPADVLEPWRLPLLAAKIAHRKFFTGEEIDDHSVEAFFSMHHEQLKKEILTGGIHPFFQKHLDRSLPAIAAGRDFEKWIKFYSISAGWQAAFHPENEATGPGVFQENNLWEQQ